MEKLEVLNPVADVVKTEATPAPRPASLEGKTLGLFWNCKPGGNHALRKAAELLQGKYPTLQVREYLGSVGSTTRYITPGDVALISAECDVVIGSTADCGSCTSWLVNDMIELEKVGIPTVSLTAEHFERDAKITAELRGLPSAPLAIVSNTFTSKTHAEIAAMIESVIGDIEVSLTTSPAATAPAADSGPVPVGSDVIEGNTFVECLDSFNRSFIEREWSDGLPLVPPTPENVRAMLARAPMASSTVIAESLYPGQGIATLEKIAINGVMAGCRPEHLPVLVALVKAYVGLGAMGKTQAMSTGPNAPLVMIAGPVIERLGFNNTTCAIGPGSPSYVNVVIGRALRLILMNIGGNYPGRMDMDTIGTANKFSFCIAENAEKSPFEPWNVAKGFGKDTSTLSIALVYPGPDVQDFASTTPEDMLDTVATFTAHYRGTTAIGRWLYGGRGEPSTGASIPERNVLLLAPDHARIFREHNWTRADIGAYLYKTSRMSFARLWSQQMTPEDKREALVKAFPQFRWLADQPDVMVPTAEGPEFYETFVVGGDVGRSQYYIGGSEISTVAIEEWA
ncbi:MAG TPA: hypothetical protein VGP26_33245 [Actinophytocola sp.]|jgi:hypothetical protein|nr:hypothetical protein [Actinophytocola sp.]